MPKIPPDNTGKVHTHYTHETGGTALTLNLKAFEATQLRSFVASLRLRGDRVPSLSLVARRAILAYLTHAQFSAETRASELAILEVMATPYGDRQAKQA